MLGMKKYLGRNINHFDTNNIPFRNIKKVTGFELVVNKFWNSEKMQLSIEILQVKYTFFNSYKEF